VRKKWYTVYRNRAQFLPWFMRSCLVGREGLAAQVLCWQLLRQVISQRSEPHKYRQPVGHLCSLESRWKLTVHLGTPHRERNRYHPLCGEVGCQEVLARSLNIHYSSKRIEHPTRSVAYCSGAFMVNPLSSLLVLFRRGSPKEITRGGSRRRGPGSKTRVRCHCASRQRALGGWSAGSERSPWQSRLSQSGHALSRGRSHGNGGTGVGYATPS
jgi:hypothetical protein